MYLIDTNVLSELAPTKTDPSADVRGWLRRNGALCRISAVSLAEIAFGAARLVRRGQAQKGAALQLWVYQVQEMHRHQVLPLTDAVAVRAGEIMAAIEAAGQAPAFEDAAIAATAELSGLVVLTRNVRDFRLTGVAHLDPFQALPPEPAG